jgi:hypothetical protein
VVNFRINGIDGTIVELATFARGVRYGVAVGERDDIVVADHLTGEVYAKWGDITDDEAECAVASYRLACPVLPAVPVVS